MWKPSIRVAAPQEFKIGPAEEEIFWEESIIEVPFYFLKFLLALIEIMFQEGPTV